MIQTENLFEKDSFSDPKMLWTEIKIDSELFSKIQIVLDKWFPDVNQEELILKVSGLGKLNSSNVLVKTKTSEYVMKIFPADRIDSAKLLEMINLHLKGKFNHAPLLIENYKGRGYTNHESSLYLLYEKVGNRHYHGEKGEFESFFEVFKNFTNNYPIKGVNYVKQPLLSSDAEGRLESFIDLDWRSNALEKYQKVFRRNFNFLVEKIKFVHKHSQESHFNNLRPMHIDLHPHNISIDENGMYFLDLEAIQLSSLSRSLGFAIYKLIRQSVANGIDLKFFHKFFKKTVFIDFLDESNLTIEELKIAALQEVLRRLFILIDFLCGGDSDWVFVLPMHLNGLSEIDRIFDT